MGDKKSHPDSICRFLFPQQIFCFSFFSVSILVQTNRTKMDERAAVPVTLPRHNPTIAYWQDPPDPEIADYLSSSQVPEIADTVIIGSGITGSFVAWNLLQSSDHGHITMLEARQACSGATGRNGNSPG
jgi:hypothetical protein